MVVYWCPTPVLGANIWHILAHITDEHRLAQIGMHCRSLANIGSHWQISAPWYRCIYWTNIFGFPASQEKKSQKHYERERDREREMTTNYVFAQVSFRLTISTLRWAMSGLSCPSTLGLCWDYICPEANRLNAELTLDRPPMEGTPSKAKVVSLQLSRIGFYQVQQIIGTPRACRISGATASPKWCRNHQRGCAFTHCMQSPFQLPIHSLTFE